MMDHQVVDVRVGKGRHQFIDAQAEQEHQRKMQDFRAAIPSHVHHVVGPGERVVGRDGKVFTEGQPITADDVGADPGAPSQGRPAWRVFADLVHDQHVIENYAYARKLEGDPNLRSVPATSVQR